MKNVALYIDNELVDLIPGTVIATSYQFADIGDLRSRLCNYSNSIKLPRTKTNDRIFGFAYHEGAITDIPYTKLPAKIVQNGIEIMPNASAVLDDVGDGYNISIYSGVFDFFDLLGGKLLSHIDFGEGLITWNASKIDTCRNLSSSALVAPVCQYGNIDTSGATFVMTGTNKVVLPSVRYKSIIEKIISNAGYTHSGSIFSDTTYLALVVPYSKDSFYFSGNFEDNREFSAEKTATQTSTNPAAGFDVVTFPVVIKQDLYGFYDSTTSRYDVSGGTDDRDFHVGFFVEVTFQLISGTYRFQLRSSDVDMPSINTDFYSTPGTYTIRFGIDIGNDDLPGFDLSFNQWVEVRVQRSVAGQIDILSGTFYNKVYAGNQQVTDPKFLIEEILPDIEQKEMMRDFAIRFGLLFFERGNILECKKFSEVIEDRTNALDWSTKRDFSARDVTTFNFSNYAQKNYFRYESEDDIYEPVHDAYFEIENENIEAENDFYESLFAGSATKEMTNASSQVIYCGHVPVFNTSVLNYASSFDNAPGLRLMLIRNKYSSEPTVTYNGSARSDYGVLYFVDPLAPYSMDWGAFLEDHYSELASLMQRPKLIERRYFLKDSDIASIGQAKLVFDNYHYYVINKIKNYVTGKVTSVQLFQVG